MTISAPLSGPFAPTHEMMPSQRRAWMLTAIAWLLVTILLLMADLLADRPIGVENWASIATTFPIVMVAGWLIFIAVIRFFRSPGLLLLSFAAVAFVTGAADAGKDVVLLNHLGSVSPPFISFALRTLVLYLLLLGMLAAIFATWVQSAQRLAQERALSLARQAEAAARLAVSQAESAAIEARLSALRYQLNPHFLFNTLNAISSMVVTGRNEAAEGMLDRLCDFLRATLATKSSGLVPIEDELATMASYLEIENFRLRDRLSVEFRCPPNLVTALVPGFMLQPLIENAVKHGVGRSSRLVNLSIAVATSGADRLRITVSDDAVPDLPPSTSAEGFGVGLGNVAERLQTLFGANASLMTQQLDTGYIATLDLPLVVAEDISDT